jgi:hypothetical protein
MPSVVVGNYCTLAVYTTARVGGATAVWAAVAAFWEVAVVPLAHVSTHDTDRIQPTMEMVAA